MRISDSQINLVNGRIEALIAAGNFYGKKLKEAGVTSISTPEEFEAALVKVFNKNKKTSIKKDLLEKLNGACITSLMGLGFLILKLTGIKIGFPGDFLILGAVVLIAVGIGLFASYFVSKKMLAKEIELEEKNLSNQE